MSTRHKEPVVVAADSVSEMADRLTTMVIDVPWSLLEEFKNLLIKRQHMTTCSLPDIVELKQQAAENPFVPQDFQNEKEEIGVWLGSRNDALSRIRQFARLDVDVERYQCLIVPFVRRTIVLTAGEWWNFRTPVVANVSPDLQVILDAIVAALENSTPRLVREGESHLPFIRDEERDGFFEFSEDAREASAMRCSRGSGMNSTGAYNAWAEAQLFRSRLTTELFESMPFGGINFLRHVVTPFTEEGVAQKSADARAFMDGNFPNDASNASLKKAAGETLEPRSKPGVYPGWSN